MSGLTSPDQSEAHLVRVRVRVRIRGRGSVRGRGRVRVRVRVRTARRWTTHHGSTNMDLACQ